MYGAATLGVMMSTASEHTSTDSPPAPIYRPRRPPSRLSILGPLAAVVVLALLASAIFIDHGGIRLIGSATPTTTTSKQIYHVTTFPLPTGVAAVDITPGPDGNLWFADVAGDAIGKITPAGAVTMHQLSPWYSSV